MLLELESFGFWQTGLSKAKYSAPPGLHDDCVMALALACWHIEHKRAPNVVREFTKKEIS